MQASDEETILVLLDKPMIRKNKIFELLDQNNLKQIEIKDKDAADLLSSPFFEIDYILVNAHSSSFEKYMVSAQKFHPNAIIICIYDKNIINTNYSKIRNGINLDYFIEKSTFTLKSFTNLMERVRQSKVEILQMNKNNEAITKERFTYIAHLGTGQNAIVDLYKDNIQNKLTAAKKIFIGKMKSEQKNKIMKELNYMKALAVPTILSIYDYQIIDNEQFIYLEYAREGTLERKLRENNEYNIKFSCDLILEWVSEILLGLFGLNKNNIIHQDVKPANILITEDNTVKLSDFGIFKVAFDESKATIIKKNPYSSPEIASGSIFSFNTDIWSLGMITYELVTGKRPFFSLNDDAFLAEVKKGNIETIKDPITHELKGLIELMLEKNPSLRYNAEELLKFDIVYDRVLALYEVKNWNKNSEIYKSFIKNGKKVFYKTFVPLNISDLKMLEVSFALYEMTPASNQSNIFGLKKQANNKYGKDMYKTMKKLILNNRKLFPNVKDTLLEVENIKNESESILTSLLVNGIIKAVNSTKEQHQIFEKENYYIFSHELPAKNQNIEIFKIEHIPYFYDLISIIEYSLYIAEILFFELNDKDLNINSNYINFLVSISYFNNYSLIDLNPEESAAALLNIYQIMYINIAINKSKDKDLTNYSFFESILNVWNTTKKEPEIIYKFKDTYLSNLEIKHVIFRNNKKPEGNFTRLAYDNSYITKIIPKFSDLRPLLILYDFSEDFQPIFKTFGIKRLEYQLEATVINFIETYLIINETDISLPLYIKPLLQDFGDDKVEFFKFLAKHYKNNLEKEEIYRIPVSSDNIQLVTNLVNILSKLRSGKQMLNFC